MSQIRCVFLMLVVLFATAARVTAQSGSPGKTTYRMHIPAYDKRVVEIRAHIVLTDSLLLMYPEGADHVPQGWATYVREFRATDDAGHNLDLRSVGPGQWIVPSPLPKWVDLQYEVMIHHDAVRWPFGSKEAAFVRDDCVFLTGKALFITQYQLADAEVHVQLPKQWSIATPWLELEPGTADSTSRSDTRIFSVPNVYELLEVAMLVGRHLERTITAGNVGITLAMGQELASALPLFEEAARPLVPATVAIFGGIPNGKFVFIANRDVYDGGTGFTRSMNMVFKDIPSIANRAEWAHVMTHEFLHLWIGSAIRTADGTQEYWFSEGFTDYLANVLQRRMGTLDDARLLERLGQHHAKYSAARATTPGVSLRSAGENKATHYDLVYSGGLLVALALEVEMRRASPDTPGVQALLNAMFNDFGRTGKPYTMQDVARLASRVAGRSLDDFFGRFVMGTETLPMPAYFAELGLSHPAAAGALIREPGAPRKALVLASRVLGID